MIKLKSHCIQLICNNLKLYEEFQEFRHIPLSKLSATSPLNQMTFLFVSYILQRSIFLFNPLSFSLDTNFGQLIFGRTFVGVKYSQRG